VSRPVDDLDPPSWPPRRHRLSELEEKTWSRARSEVLVPYRPRACSSPCGVASSVQGRFVNRQVAGVIRVSVPFRLELVSSKPEQLRPVLPFRFEHPRPPLACAPTDS
jgi:hypothetical protein